MKRKWGIVGLGWLGRELTRQLRESRIEYWGTTRKEFNWEIDDFPSTSCDVLFLNTPPLTHISPIEFISKINFSGRIIFISSIGVYGNVIGTVTEETTPHPISKNGVWLYEVENLLLKKFKNHITIIRAGGLIGGARHPVISLARKSGQVVPDRPVNLIHRNDLIGIVFAVLEHQVVIPLVNAIAPYHPLKSQYYELWCHKLNLGPLRFSHCLESNIIIHSLFLDKLYPHWLCPTLDTL